MSLHNVSEVSSWSWKSFVKVSRKRKNFCINHFKNLIFFFFFLINKNWVWIQILQIHRYGHNEYGSEKLKKTFLILFFLLCFLCVKILRMMKVRMLPWVTAPMPSEQRKGFDVTISHTFLVFLLFSFIIHSYIIDTVGWIHSAHLLRSHRHFQHCSLKGLKGRLPGGDLNLK